MIAKARWTVLCVAGLLASCATTLSASDVSRPRVAYAGFALVGAADDLRDLYPAAYELQATLNAALYERVQDVRPEHYDLVTSSILQADKGDTVALAFALEFERVSVERIAGVYKALVEFSAQALVFDFDGEERAIIASYPVQQLPYVDVFEERPTAAQLNELARRYLLTGFDGGESLIDEFVNVIARAPIRQKYAQELGIGEILFTDDALAQIPSTQRESMAAFQYQIGRRLASELARHQGVSVIPFQPDASVANLAMRFTGERSMTFLRLPEPDYVVDMALLTLSRDVYSASSVGKAYLYGAHAQMRLREGFSAETALFNQYVLNGEVKEVPASQDEIDHWSASLDSLWGLLAGFSSEIDSPSREWTKVHELTRADQNEYKAFAEVLEQCR
ncbi:MAG: hypothetical protein AAFM91_13305 [Pseudomonadota bacterium]